MFRADADKYIAMILWKQPHINEQVLCHGKAIKKKEKRHKGILPGSSLCLVSWKTKKWKNKL